MENEPNLPMLRYDNKVVRTSLYQTLICHNIGRNFLNLFPREYIVFVVYVLDHTLYLCMAPFWMGKIILFEIVEYIYWVGGIYFGN
jgi:hypothetical protein